MYLASGTDEIYMKEEARLLGVVALFRRRRLRRAGRLQSFSKKILIQRILSSTDVRGEEIVGFGDGYVEIEEVKLVGGVTVGVATKEPECAEVDDWKRQRLIGVGADYIVPNFLGHASWSKRCLHKVSPAQVNTLAIDIGGTKFAVALLEGAAGANK